MARTTAPTREVERDLRGERCAVEATRLSGQFLCRRFRSGFRVVLDAKNTNWPIDVLDPALTFVLERQIGIAEQLIADTAGYVDLARFGQAFEPGGDVDAVPVNIAFIDDHVTGVDADAELDLPAPFQQRFRARPIRAGYRSRSAPHRARCRTRPASRRPCCGSGARDAWRPRGRLKSLHNPPVEDGCASSSVLINRL